MEENVGVDELLANVPQSPATGLSPIDLRGPIGGMAKLGHDDGVGAPGLCQLDAARVPQPMPSETRPYFACRLQPAQNSGQRLAELARLPV